MTTARLQSLLSQFGGLAVSGIWHIAGAWLALAMYYTSPLPYPLRVLLAILTLALFLLGWRRTPRWRLAAFLLFVAYTGYHFVLYAPPRHVEWAPDHVVAPTVTLDGQRAIVRNVRNFSWRSPADFTRGYYDATYDAAQITSMHYAVVPFSPMGSLAHVFVSFGFEDGRHVAVSVEARRRLGQTYGPLPGLFRQYQLLYVIGDERDVIGLRAVAGDRIQFYPAAATPQAMRAIFLDLMTRARDVDRRPEFYNTLTSNCMSNLLLSLRKLPGLQLPSEARLIFSGFSDEAAYDLGYLDTPLPFDHAREAFRIDERVRRHLHDPDFSVRIRGRQ